MVSGPPEVAICLGTLSRRRLVVLVSGSGSNLQAILDACAGGTVPADVVGVISNRRDAYGLVRAEQAGVPGRYFPYKPYRDAGRSRTEYDADLAAEVAAFAPDVVVLAGWMHILSAAFLDRFPNRVLNLHPALPGMFTGTHAIERAFEAYQLGEIQREWLHGSRGRSGSRCRAGGGDGRGAPLSD